MRNILKKEIGKVTDEELKEALQMTENDITGNMKVNVTKSDYLNIMSTCIDVIRRCANEQKRVYRL